MIESKPTSGVIESIESKHIDSDSVCTRSGAKGGFIPHERYTSFVVAKFA
ncbi:hypothetical protein [uncultured Helicobacter sp.]